MDIRILEDDKDGGADASLYRGRSRSGATPAIAVNMQGGGGFEVWQYAERKPQPLGFELNMGDLGVLVCKVKSRDVAAAYEQFSKNPRANLIRRGDIKASTATPPST
jgi:hypothetical protein